MCYSVGMNETMYSEQPPRPSAFGAFFSGAKSGLFSGIVMALVIAVVMPALPFLSFGLIAGTGATFLGSLAASGPIMILAATLFGGIMGAKRAVFDAPHGDHTSVNTDIVPVPVPTMAGPVMAPVMTFGDNAEQAPTKNWVAETGRSEGSQSRIQQILADGSLSDKDRASAILASREAADQQASRA